MRAEASGLANSNTSIRRDVDVEIAADGSVVARHIAESKFKFYRFEVPVESKNTHKLCINEMQLISGDMLLTPVNPMPCTSFREGGLVTAPCVSASTYEPGWEAKLAFDGSNLKTEGEGWCTKAGDGYGWLTFKFERPTAVDLIRLYFWRRDHSAEGTAYLKASPDGDAWHTLKEITDTHYATLDIPEPEKGVCQAATKRPAEGEYRFWRYRVPKSSANAKHLCINEMELYDDEDAKLELFAIPCGCPPCSASSSNWAGAKGIWPSEYAFDGIDKTVGNHLGQNIRGGQAWCTRSGVGYGWLMYKFTNPKPVKRARIWFWSKEHSALGHAFIEASNDGLNWSILSTIKSTKYEELDNSW
jgi:hypothetical protein